MSPYLRYTLEFGAAFAAGCAVIGWAACAAGSAEDRLRERLRAPEPEPATRVGVIVFGPSRATREALATFYEADPDTGALRPRTPDEVDRIKARQREEGR